MSEAIKTLPRRIRFAREQIPGADGKPYISQDEFALRLGVSRSAVANWEAGHASPDLSNLQRIAELSGVMFEWLALDRGPRKWGEPRRVEEPRGVYVDDGLKLALLALVDMRGKDWCRALLSVVSAPAK